MEEHFYTRRGIYYRVNDMRPERVTLVLIHGLSGSSSAWLPFEQAWEREYNVLAVDLRGHGKSLKPTRYADYDIDAMVEDIALLMDELHVGRYIPLSQSFGVLLAIKLLEQRKGAVAAVFMSSIYGIYTNLLTRLSRFVVYIAGYIARPFPYSTVPGGHVDYDRFRRAGDWNMHRILRDIPNTTWHVWLYCLDHLYRHDFDPLWRRVAVPSLILHGKQDSISPVRHAVELVGVIPHAKLELIEHSSHVFPLISVAEALRRTTAFLRDTLQAAGLEQAA